MLRQGTIASHPLAPVTSIDTFFVDYAHFGGDSGSAAIAERDGRPLVTGVVVSMQRQTDRVKSPFEEKTVHTPLGLAIVVPADRLRDTISRWSAGRPEPAAPVCLRCDRRRDRRSDEFDDGLPGFEGGDDRREREAKGGGTRSASFAVRKSVAAAISSSMEGFLWPRSSPGERHLDTEILGNGVPSAQGPDADGRGKAAITVRIRT